MEGAMPLPAQAGSRRYSAPAPRSGGSWTEDTKRLMGASLSSQTSVAARQSFAYMFTVACLCLYSGPVILAVQLGRDHDAAFWIGRWGQLAGLVPLYILMMHLVIIAQFATEDRRCRKSIFVWTAVLPAVLLAFIGGSYMTNGRFWEQHLLSEECTEYSAEVKFHLQRGYNTALGMYKTCEKNLIAANGGNMPVWRPTLQTCQEFTRMSSADPEAWQPVDNVAEISHNWDREFHYLASVEANHACGGFCAPGPMLWSDYDITGGQGGKCSPMVGRKMHVVAHEGLVLLVVSLVGISSFFFLWAAADEKLKPFFYEEQA